MKIGFFTWEWDRHCVLFLCFLATCFPWSIAQSQAEPCIIDPESHFIEGKFSYRRLDNGKLKDDASGRFKVRVPISQGWNSVFYVTMPPALSASVGPPLSILDHMQGIVRVDTNGRAYMIGAMGIGPASSYSNGSIYVWEMGEVPQGRVGERLVRDDENPRAFQGGDSGGRNRMVGAFKLNTTSHPGGMQAVGTLVAVPIRCEKNCDESSVQFYDFVDPARPVLVEELMLGDKDAAHWVAFTRLKDDRHLVIVNRGDSAHNDVWVTSTKGDLGAATRWDEWDALQHVGAEKWNPKRAPQNVNLFYDCGPDGQLYLLTMGSINTKPWKYWTDDNEMLLYRIAGRLSQGTARLELVSRATSERHGDFCQMRGASSLFVTHSHEPIVYCTAGWVSKVGVVKDGAASLKISELTAAR